ncbi:hypothetical protein [Streptomyces sp. NPDC046985]|uniref:hypothetical protein n=1 Tax=Streptomyces sp. NPDC046985 TaxID=3155377 RepID=UPI0033D8D5C1
MQTLSSRHSWILAFGEAPAALPSAHDTVRVSLALGLSAIDGLVTDEAGVGSVKCCLVHSQLLVPVESGTAIRWHAPHSVCVSGTPRCAAEGYRRCLALWMTPPRRGTDPLTAADALHEALSRTRSRMRTGRGVRQVCRA